MKEIIDYIKKYFINHPRTAITLKILGCLDYIERNIDILTAEASHKQLLIHPENDFALHLPAYPAQAIAKEQLLHLAHEVRASFTDMMTISDATERYNVMSSFLNIINDSEDVNIEARLRPALTYLAQYQTTGNQQAQETAPSLAPKDKEEIYPITIATAPAIDASLTNKQREAIRKQLRERAPRVILAAEYVIKSLRVDEHNYVRRFVEMITPPHKKHPLRAGNKGFFTATGRGIYSRFGHGGMRKKKPQYSDAEKQGFSKTQSCSYGFIGYTPSVFGFDKRRDKLVGVILDAENFLLSDRLYVYDGGTVTRPYDFDSETDTSDYFARKSGSVLFHRDQLQAYKKALLDNKDKHNEAMARLRWGDANTSRIFIGSDSLAARLWAQDYARILALQLKIPNTAITICYYLPDNPGLHLTTYTQKEQELDRIEARNIYENVSQRHIYYNQDDYSILLALPPDKLENLFNRSQNSLLTILAKGHFHVVQSLLEMAEASGQGHLRKDLYDQLASCHNEDLITRIISHCETKILVTLSLQILIHLAKNINAKYTDGNTILILAATNGHTDIVTTLLTRRDIRVNIKNDRGCTALMYAAKNNHKDIVTDLLAHPDIKVNLQGEHGRSALSSAAQYGHTDIVRALLAFPDIKFNQENQFGKTALMFAADFGHLDIVTALLAQPGIDVNQRDKQGLTATTLAIRCANKLIIAALLAHPGNKMKLSDAYFWSIIVMAYRLGHIDIVATVLAHPKLEVDLILIGTDAYWASRLQNKKYATVMQNYLIDHYLPNYINRRRNQDEYHHFYGKWFGVSKDAKLAAAEALLNNEDLSTHTKALSGGELEDIYKVLIICRTTLGIQSKPNPGR